MIIKWLFTDYQWYIMIPDDRMVWWNIHEYPCPMMSHDPWHSCPFGTKTISPFHLCHNPSYHFTRFHKESKPWDGIGSCNTVNTFHHISPHFTTSNEDQSSNDPSKASCEMTLRCRKIWRISETWSNSAPPIEKWTVAKIRWNGYCTGYSMIQRYLKAGARHGSAFKISPKIIAAVDDSCLRGASTIKHSGKWWHGVANPRRSNRRWFQTWFWTSDCHEMSALLHSGPDENRIKTIQNGSKLC